MSSEIQPVNEHRTDLINILNTSTTEALNNINVGGFYFLQKKTNNGYHFCFIKVSSKEPVYSEDNQLIDFDITGSTVYIITDITGRIINSAEIGIRSIKNVMSNNTHLASDNWMMYVSNAGMYNGKLYEVCYNITPADSSCLNFTSVLDGSVVGIKHQDTLGELPPDFQYSYDLETWNNWEYQTTTESNYTVHTFSNITLNKGDRIYVRSHADTLGQDSNNYTNFLISGSVLSTGNIQSLIGFKNSVPAWCYSGLFNSCDILTAPELPATIMNENCYQNMFYHCEYLISAPTLPATKLASYCYRYMFSYCRSLTSAPGLPATVLASYCYYGMFSGCTSLTSAPELPAPKLSIDCYYYMFSGCTSLTQAPELPATILAAHCYRSMFNNCTSLTSAPELRATQLADSCYRSMFNNCTSLTSAPELPAAELAQYCYASMFSNCTNLIGCVDLSSHSVINRCYNEMYSGCTKLNNIITPYIDTWTESYFTNWVQNVAPTGTMYKPNNLTIPVGNNGIPSGWVTAPVTKTITLSAVGKGSQFGYMITGDSTVYIINPGETKQVTINENQTISLDSMSQLCVIIDGIMTMVLSEPTSINFTNVRKNISCQLPSTMSNLFCISSVDNTSISVKMDHYGTNQDNNQTHPILYASIDSGSWDLWSGQEITGNKIYFWGPNQSISSSTANYSTFSKGSTGGYWKLSGNIQTLIGGRSQFQNQYCFYRLFYNNTYISDASALQLSVTDLTQRYCYQYMFAGCSALTQAPELPATTLSTYCYNYMFQNCSLLTRAPELPAINLALYCYQNMFSGCTALTQAPALPATTLTGGCYLGMFRNCRSLTQAPELPATTLVSQCYQSMFSSCYSLTQAPALPATTLASQCYKGMFQNCTHLTHAPELSTTTLAYYCYQNMFSGCTSLTQAPALPAITLIGTCYSGMFSNCTSLNYIEIGATSWDSSYTTDWVSGVPSSGTFIKPASLVIGTDTGQIPQNSANGIPSGWTVINF